VASLSRLPQPATTALTVLAVHVAAFVLGGALEVGRAAEAYGIAPRSGGTPSLFAWLLYAAVVLAAGAVAVPVQVLLARARARGALLVVTGVVAMAQGWLIVKPTTFSLLGSGGPVSVDGLVLFSLPAGAAVLTCYVVVLTTVAVALVAGDRTSAEPAR